jgi:predicted MFS family arabinose efflux permease
MMNSNVMDRPTHSAVSVMAVIGISIVSALVANTLPAFLAIVASERGFTESQAGLCAMADMGGMALGVIGCAMLPRLIQWLNWRQTVRLGLLLLILANLMSIVTTEFIPYLAVRVASGIGSGLVVAIAFAVLGEGDGARSMGFFNIGQLGAAWLAIPYFTPLAEQYGISVIFKLIAAFAAFAFLFTVFLPRTSCREVDESTQSHTHEKISMPGWMAIVAVFVFWFGVGATFGFLSFMGVAWGGDPLAVEDSVSKILFAGMTGATVVAIMGSRFGHFKAFATAYCGVLTAIGLFLYFNPVAAFLAIGALFYFCVTVTSSYQFEVVTKVDTSSSAAMMVMAATVGSIAIGPAIAGYLVTPNYELINGLGFISIALSFVLMLVAVRMSRNVPAA